MDDGCIELTVPTPAYSTCIPLRLISPPLPPKATSTERMPAPRAGTVHTTPPDGVMVAMADAHVSDAVDAPKPQYAPAPAPE